MIRYLLGAVGLGMVVAAAAFAGTRWRRRLLGNANRPLAAVADVVLTVAHLLVAAELLGVVGAFRPVPFVGLVVVASALSSWLANRRPAAGDVGASGPAPVVDRVTAACCIVIVLVVACAWVTGTLQALSSGVTDVDSQYYHLPHAAAFVQDASITHLHLVNAGDASAYHPMNAELVHAIGILLLGTDVLSTGVNLAWLGLALLAAWGAGRALGSGPVGLAGVSVLVATPVLVRTQSGTAHNDVFGLAFLLCAIAVLLPAPSNTGHVAVAAIASGLALGTKLSLLVPVGVLTLLVVLLGGDRRWRRGSLWVAGLASTSAVWYLRNLAHTGNPIPSLQIGFGPATLPRPPMRLIDEFGYSVADYLTDTEVWTRYFIPGLATAFARTWPLLLALAGAGTLAALIRAPSFRRGVAVVAAASAVAYVLTPTTAFGAPGEPLFFTENLRYLTPALGVGSVLVASIGPVARRVRLYCAGAALVAFASVVWPGGGRVAPPARAVLAAAAALGVAIVFLRGRAVIAAALVAALAGGYLVQERYLERRYTPQGSYEAVTSRDPAAFFWAQGVSDARIGIAGFFVQYPLYGADLSNSVQYVGDHRPDGAFVDFRSCRAWVQALERGRYDYVVVMGPFADSPLPAQARWTRTGTASTTIVATDRVVVFERAATSGRC